jgi:hypothetical protein
VQPRDFASQARESRAEPLSGAGDGDPPASMVPALTLRPAVLADIGAIMAIERSLEFELCVEEAEHRAMLDSPSHAYRLGIGAGGAVEAFAILRGLGDAHANLYLKRGPCEGFEACRPLRPAARASIPRRPPSGLLRSGLWEMGA